MPTMAHHQQTDNTRRSSAIRNIMKMLHLAHTPTGPALDEDDFHGDSDEPPEHRLVPLRATLPRTTDFPYPKQQTPVLVDRRESLLTRAIVGEPKSPTSRAAAAQASAKGGLSTTSSHSTGSVPSTAELTSDEGSTTSHSVTSSPPLTPFRYNHVLAPAKDIAPPSSIVAAKVSLPNRPAVVDSGEAALEKTLGRKRCIMFACAPGSDTSKDDVTPKPETDQSPLKRKSALTFACPFRDDNQANTRLMPPAKSPEPMSPNSDRRSSADSGTPFPETGPQGRPMGMEIRSPQPSVSPTRPFHEFGSSHRETDPWVDHPTDTTRRLTLDDCMRKEKAIQEIGREAEEEAQEEEREQEERENEEDEVEQVDDFAPSDESSDDESTGGNESDDEGGFAESDDESDAGSDYLFWVPSNTSALLAAEPISHISSRQRSFASSVDSSPAGSPKPNRPLLHLLRKRRSPKASKNAVRLPTPELPDSTDFVCGTLDEDQLLEAAYISCREQRKREKHVPIPKTSTPASRPRIRTIMIIMRTWPRTILVTTTSMMSGGRRAAGTSNRRCAPRDDTNRRFQNNKRAPACRDKAPHAPHRLGAFLASLHDVDGRLPRTEG